MKKKVLILGATGMLGHVMLKQLSLHPNLEVYATVRSSKNLHKWFPQILIKKIINDVDVSKTDKVISLIASLAPDFVINCIGVTRQTQIADDYLSAININACLPHHLSSICKIANARLIHISSDGVFDGSKGMYSEQDKICAVDFYGMTKFLGEISDSHCLTLRISIIGHELEGHYRFVEWFLSQNGKVKGYKRAIYSGFPTVELAKIIIDYVLPNENLTGIYHVSSEPISKFDLLHLIANRYAKKIEIQPFGEPVIDRSLDSSAFRSFTGYTPPSWPELVDKMYVDYIKNKEYLCLV